MLTPQEVASHAFSKATLGGYNMAMVDEFLDLLTEDYTSLYNDNAILKNKLKVLSETVEEYRATDNAMRKTLLAAQRMADSIVAEAEEKKSALVRDAEGVAESRIRELQDQIRAEEYRLKVAREATAAYVAQLRAAQARELAVLDELDKLAPPAQEPEDDAAADIQASLSALSREETEPEREEESVPASAPLDLDATRRFEDLQFGQDYEIE